MQTDTTMLIRKLDSIAVLTKADRQVLADLPLRIRDLEPHEDLLREGETPHECCVLIEGFMHRYQLLPNGKRQILSLHTCGDVPDLQSLALSVMDHNVAALGQCRVGLISHDVLRTVMRDNPGIAEAFWRDALIDTSIFRTWITCLGQRSARGHMAHLLCEVFTRLRAVGLTRDDACDLPITQVELGAALGLSTVHVNRVLQKFRAQGLIRLTKSRLTILDWKALAAVAQFDPAYLHLRHPDVTARVSSS